MRAYLFDLDGTLIDHFAAIHRSYVHTLTRMGLPAPTQEQVRASVGGGLENAMLRFIPPDRLQEGLSLYLPYWEETLLQDVELMPGALEVLRMLHERRADSVVITNKLGTSARRICDHLGMTPYLRAVVGAGDSPWLKPAPEFTRHVLQRIGATPDQTLLIGDSPYDVEAAHAARIPAWCVATGTHSRAQLLAAGTNRVFDGLPDLMAAL